MVKKPTITVITVCYNSEDFIDCCLRSVLLQDYPPDEYIIVDGGSNDSTLNIIDEHRQAYFKVISEPDKGLYDAMNKGIRASKGDFILFLNSDDYLADCKTIQKIKQVLDKGSLFYGAIQYVDRFDVTKQLQLWAPSQGAFEKFNDGWHPAHPAFICKRSILLDLGGFDLKYKIAADFDLMLRAFQHHGNRSVKLDFVITKMRVGGLSNAGFINILKGNNEVRHALRACGFKVSYFYTVKRLIGKFFKRNLRFLGGGKR